MNNDLTVILHALLLGLQEQLEVNQEIVSKKDSGRAHLKKDTSLVDKINLASCHHVNIAIDSDGNYAMSVELPV